MRTRALERVSAESLPKCLTQPIILASVCQQLSKQGNLSRIYKIKMRNVKNIDCDTNRGSLLLGDRRCVNCGKYPPLPCR